MITGIFIGNFKAFKDLKYIPLQPLTLIFGPNSGGKSSVIHALLLLNDFFNTRYENTEPQILLNALKEYYLNKSLKKLNNIRKEYRSINITKTRLGGNWVNLGGFNNFIHKCPFSEKISNTNTISCDDTEDTLVLGLEVNYQKNRLLKQILLTKMKNQKKKFTFKIWDYPYRIILYFKQFRENDGSVTEPLLFKVRHIAYKLFDIEYEMSFENDIFTVYTKQNKIYPEIYKLLFKQEEFFRKYFPDEKNFEMITNALEKINENYIDYSSMQSKEYLSKFENTYKDRINNISNKHIISKERIKDKSFKLVYFSELSTIKSFTNFFPKNSYDLNLINLISYLIFNILNLLSSIPETFYYSKAKINELKSQYLKLDFMTLIKNLLDFFNQTKIIRYLGIKSELSLDNINFDDLIKLLLFINNIVDDILGILRCCNPQLLYFSNSISISAAEDNLENELNNYLKIASVFGLSVKFPKELYTMHTSSLDNFDDFFERQQLLVESINHYCDFYYNIIKDCITNQVYLGPFRELPSKFQSDYNSSDRNWTASGLVCYRELIDNEELRRKVNKWLSGKYNSSKLNNSMLPQYEIILKELVYKDTAEKPVITEVFLKSLQTGKELTMWDVGTGNSQAIPVIVTALANKSKLITIEQPELHLHPALQSDIADVFINSCYYEKDSLIKKGEFPNLILLETHSEHIILRIQKRIKQTHKASLPKDENNNCLVTPIYASDVAIIYVRPPNEDFDEDIFAGAIVDILRLDQNGSFIDTWPYGFFVERYKELLIEDDIS